MTPLPPLLQAFFTERLARQRDASPHTIAAYRDSFRLLLAFMHQQTGKPPSKLVLEDLDAVRISAFLTHLETERGNSVRTRNARLTAIHSFFHYAALRAPEQAELIARVLAIPEKRFDTTLISYLTEPELDALLAAPDRSTWTGRRDHALLLLAVQTGLRASELASLRGQDLQLDSPRLGQMPRQRPEGEVHPAQPPDQASAARSGCANETATRPARCSPTAAVSTSPGARSGGSSSSTPPPPATGATHSKRRTSPRTCCGTPPRCDCCMPRPRSTSRRSRCGSATRPSTPPTSTSTPTWNSNDARWTAPHPRTPRLAATGLPTRCSRSSRASDPPEICSADRHDPQRGPSIHSRSQHSSRRNIGRQTTRSGDRPMGVRAARTLAAAARHAFRRSVLLRAARPDPRPGLGASRCPRRPSCCASSGWCPTSLRRAPAPSCSRRGDVTRRGAAPSHPAPARAR